MALTLGRIGLSTNFGGDNRTLNEPYEWGQSGQQITLQGVYKASSDTDAVSFANSVTGLDPALSDVDWVPVTSSVVSRINGYYRVLSATAGFGRASLGTGTLLVDWQVQLERPRTFRLPRIEIPIVLAGLTNGMSVTSFTPIVGMATAAWARLDTLLGAAGWTSVSRDSEYGTVEARYYTPSPAIATTGNILAVMNIDPGSYYAGGAAILDSVGPMHGRRDIDIANSYSIGNGIVRIVPAAQDLDLSWWVSGTGWTSARTLRVCNEVGGTTYLWTMRSAQVLRNSPVECILRLVGTNAYSGECSIDLSMRRGERLVRVIATQQDNVGGMQIRFSTGAGTSTTFGIRNTTAINSEYIVLTSDQASSKTTTSPARLTRTGNATRTLFTIGATSGGGTGTTPNAADGIGSQAYATYGEVEQVVFG